MTKMQEPWRPYLQRYYNGGWRALIFKDMIINDIMKINKKNDELTLLDIGCGNGFDKDAALQKSLSRISDQYIGIEPDNGIKLSDIFTKTYRCSFGDAQIAQESIDIAFAVMVLEHFEKPKMFWNKIYQILKPGGIFWGFTVDARHFFVLTSILTEKLHIKDWYLNFLHGKRGEERYENYSVYYRCNTPRHIEPFTNLFSSRTFLNFSKVGQLDYYLPKSIRWIGRLLDNATISIGWPGSILSIRLEK